MGQEQNETIQNLDNINPEGLKKSGKVDKKGSSRFNWKKLVCITLIIGGVVVAVWKGIPYVSGHYMVPEIPYTINDTIAANANETSLDEILEYKVDGSEVTLLEQVAELEKYLDMSNKLSALKLPTYTNTVIEVVESETFYTDLQAKYQEFVELSSTTKKDVLSQNSLRLHQLAAELNGYKLVVDSKITTDGYDILADYGIVVAKAALLDASGISYTNIDNLTIPAESDDYKITYTDPVTGKVFETRVGANSIIGKVISNVYSAQTKDTDNLTTEQIIADLTEYLNTVKVATFMRYENDGILGTTNNYNDVREIIEPVKVKK